MDKGLMSPGGQKGHLPVTPLAEESAEGDVPQTPVGSRGTLDRSQMSPMHPPRPLVIKEEEHEEQEDESGSWVGRQVGSLFSPMLNLLEKEGEEGEEAAEEGAAEPSTEEPGDVPEPQPEEPDEPQARHEDEEEESGYSQGEKDEEDVLVDDDGSSQDSLDEDEFNPYVFIKSLPSYDLVAPLRPPIALPPKQKNSPPISLVLDLDETLVHCTVEPVEDADLVFPVVFHGMTYQVHVRLRPYLFEFLDKIQDKYEVIVFTASQQVYADELLNLIDPGKKFR